MTPRKAITPMYEVMTQDPVTIGPTTSLSDVMALFDRHDFNALPVIGEQGVLLGIVTKLDLLRAFRPDPSLESYSVAHVSARLASDVMGRGLVTVEAEDPAVRAADLMVETRLRSLPVVDRKNGRPILVGIVSQGDLIRALRIDLAEAGAVQT